ncbi:hypothetical protein GTU79_18435 [Sodalis ligni]|uniref:hypothetical protein n=1 Tax=Sodalis ligni TaxID=2697027 RepID=UPI001BDEC926|nr:hypothetical protein [Sodalis ligni]QWA09359.1 hypothetical protein GTU79_18435 [Sodalis ligni]
MVFYYDREDQSSTDDGGMIIIGKDGSCWKRRIEDFVDVGWFGIIPEKDCTKQIDNCVSFAMSRGIFYKKIDENVNDLELDGIEIRWGLGEYLYNGSGFIRNKGSNFSKSLL